MRPEHTAPPEIFYNVDEAQKYSRNTRIMEIQATMSERAIEMLNLKEDEPSYILDVGCGSGLSGECLDEQVITTCGLMRGPRMCVTCGLGFTP